MSMRCTLKVERFEFTALSAPLGARNDGCGACSVRVYQDDADPLGGLPVVVVGELADNPGPQLCEVIAHVATQVWTELLPALEAAPVVVMHWPHDHPERPGPTRSSEATFLLVDFEIVNPAWRRLRWESFQPLDHADLAAWIGPAAASELAAWRCQGGAGHGHR